MAANVTVSFWAANDINGTPLWTITDEDSFFKGLTLKPDLYGLGGWELTLARSVGIGLFGDGPAKPEVFVRFLIAAYSTTDWYFGGQLNKRQQDLVQRDELGAEEFIFGGPGPKQYLDRYRVGIEQNTGTGFNLDLANGVWRWNENATAGRIVSRLVLEDNAADPQALVDLTKSFSDGFDSDGVAWVDDIAGPNDFEVPIGQSLLETIWDLEDLSDFQTSVDLGTVADPRYLLEARQTFGEDVTGTAFGSGVGLLREGVNIANDSLSVQGVSLRKASHVIVEGKDGVWVNVAAPSWSPGDYVKWSKISYARSHNVNILEKAGVRWLRRQDQGDQELTVEILPGADDTEGLYFPSPTSPIWLGNTVSVDTVTEDLTKTPLDYDNEDALVTGLELVLGPAGSDLDATAKARSWDIKVRLNQERGGNQASPSNGSASGGNGGNGGGGCKCIGLCKVHVEGDPPSEVVTPVKHFNANSDGGDTLTWGGLLANQGPPGAGGSTHYYFKAGTPDTWSAVYAVSAGVTLRVSGYTRNMTSSENLVIGFFNSGIGVGGDPVLLVEAPTVLATNTPGSTWVAFTWDIVTPATTVGFGISRTGNVDFDQLHIDSVDYDPGAGGQDGDIPEDVGEEGASGTDASAARCDHVHAHGFLSDDGLHHHDVTQIEDGTAAVDTHTADTSDAHDASAISVLDTGAHFTATDVEAALAELYTVATAPGGSGIGEILIADTGISTPLVFADLIQNEAQDDLVYADP